MIERKTESTGIYRTNHVSSGPDLADQKAVFAEAKKGFATARDLDATLDRIEAAAAERTRGERPEVQADAETLLFDLGQLRKALADDDTRAVAHWALHLGAMSERMAVRWAEPLVIHGRKTLAATGTARTERTKATKARYAMIREHVAARMKAHPKDSLSYARSYVATQLGISISTVIRAEKRKSKQVDSL